MALDYATKKECASLLAELGEESWRNVTKRGGGYHSVGWVHGRIMTVEDAGNNMLVRLAAAFQPESADEVERLVEEAAMREEGYYHFSSRTVAGLVLAEITIYEIVGDHEFVLECDTMNKKLDEVLNMGG